MLDEAYIRGLCANAIAASDEDALEILLELQRALREYMKQVRKIAIASHPITASSELPR